MDYKMNTIRRSTLSQQVLERIIHLIMNGQLNPGDKLPSEMTLIERFDVSRPVLREALSSLETLEIITRRPRGGTYVNKKVGSNPFEAMLALSINNVPAVIEARMSLELGLVAIAAEKISRGQLEKLKETIEQIQANADSNYGRLDKEFHSIIAKSANNPIVEGMIDSLLIAHEKTDSLIPYREPGITVEHHLAIYEALKKRDPHESFNQMYRHLSFVRKKLLDDYEADKKI
ncbi:FadR/GntR family transcriptional regulator [Oceanobacillus saliphilus]|uniref:FadR/GntR family transcriptional regulator n=1 Tax=Oceanobacillus saliphilus TaxID=2925834 RepID=UPI00201DB13D|nr:FadR/GntR family transcriptional regulator [Oceanobacillus saliphilus]